jgi:hypothetical protein
VGYGSCRTSSLKTTFFPGVAAFDNLHLFAESEISVGQSRIAF